MDNQVRQMKNRRGMTGEKLLTVLFFLIVFLLGVTKIEDTDTWTHLSFGKWIWESHEIPSSEPFIRTGTPFPYNNWLFGFLLYGSYYLFNITGVILFKAAVVAAAFAILFRDALRPHRNLFVAALVMTVIIMMARHRFIERPDIFLMVFLSFSIFCLNACLYEGKKYLYVLPLMHVVWANSHTSLPLMAVPFLSFFGGGFLQSVLNRKDVGVDAAPDFSRLRVIGMVFLISFAASLISPYFITQYTHGMEALSMSWWKQEINELKTPTWDVSPWPYLLTVAAAISFLINLRRLSLIHLFLILPFLILSFTSIRFIFLAGIVSGPVIARNLSSFISTRSWSGIFRKKYSLIAAAIFMVLCAALVATGTYAHLDEGKKHPGFGVAFGFFPEGALRFMDAHAISGMVYNLFQWGGYITYRDFPRRVPFIDGRGFTDPVLLEKVTVARRNQTVLDELGEKYGFDSVLVDYPRSPDSVSGIFTETDIAFSHPGWVLVYWDDNALLYLKRGGVYDQIVREEGYHNVRPANGIAGLKTALAVSNQRDGLISELKRCIERSDAYLPALFLGFVYNETGMYREALAVYQKALNHPRAGNRAARSNLYRGIAYASLRLGNVRDAIASYEMALSLEEDAEVLFNLGVIFADLGEQEKARMLLEKAVKLDRKLTDAYPYLARIYGALGMKKEEEKAMQSLQAAAVSMQGEEHFQSALRFYQARVYDQALAEFRKSLGIFPRNPAALSNMGYIYYDTNDLDRAFEYQKKAIEVDRTYANAYYGLALVFKKRGDSSSAKKHWEEYLRIEPQGYYSRKAVEEIKALEKVPQNKARKAD